MFVIRAFDASFLFSFLAGMPLRAWRATVTHAQNKKERNATGAQRQECEKGKGSATNAIGAHAHMSEGFI